MKMTKTKHTLEQYEAMLKKQNHQCAICGREGGDDKRRLLEVAKDLVKLEADRLKGFLKRDDYECRMATARKIIAQVV